MKTVVDITAIMLRKGVGVDGHLGHAIVQVEIDGKWVEVIRETIDANFSHIVEGVGIWEARKKREVLDRSLPESPGRPQDREG